MQYNNHSLILEYYLFDSNSLIRRGKHKAFIKQCEKLVISQYFLQEQYDIQLQIQLARRLMHCKLRLLKHYFKNYEAKQQKIVTSLGSCMELCQSMIALFNKCEYLLTNEGKSRRKQIYKQSKERLTIKEFVNKFSNEATDRKTLYWLASQQETLYVLIQELNFYCYLFYKSSKCRESLHFIQKLVKLQPKVQIQSQIMHLTGQTMLNNAMFELSYRVQDEDIKDISSNLLIDVIRYVNQQKLQSNKYWKARMKHIICLIIINLYTFSKQLEYQDKYVESLRTLSLANFFSDKLLRVMDSYEEFTQFIAQEFEQQKEKYEEVLLGQHEIMEFIILIFGVKQSNKPINKQFQVYESFQQQIQAKYGISDNQFVVQKPKVQFIPKSHRKSNSQQSTNEATLINSSTKEFTSYHQKEYSKDDTPIQSCLYSSFNSINNVPLKRPKTATKKKQLVRNWKESYLSQLINLRKLSEYRVFQEKPESELEKNVRVQTERLHKLSQPQSFKSVDRFFKRRIEAITFEQCLTLDQVKSTAEKIIGAEWDVHKEMPVTKSLMKSIQVSQLQIEQLGHLSKLQEYYAIEKQAYDTVVKDRAESLMKENKQIKQIQLNQHQFQQMMNVRRISKLGQISPREQGNDDEIRQSQRYGSRVIPTQVLTMQQQLIKQQENVGVRQHREFVQTKKMLMELMVDNLEQMDDLHDKELLLKQQVLPRQYTQRLLSPRQSELRSCNTSPQRSVAYSFNSKTNIRLFPD